MSVSAEFDATFYLTNNADVVLAISQGNFANGLDHYNQFGGRVLRAPNSTFDPNYYAINNSDVLSFEINLVEVTRVEPINSPILS